MWAPGGAVNTLYDLTPRIVLWCLRYVLCLVQFEMCSARHKRICCTHVLTGMSVSDSLFHPDRARMHGSRYQRCICIVICPKTFISSPCHTCLHMSVPHLWSPFPHLRPPHQPLRSHCRSIYTALIHGNEEYGSVVKTNSSTFWSPGIFLGYASIAGRICKGYMLVAEIEELERLDASEVHARRLNAKEVLTPHRSETYIFHVADGTAKLFGRDHGVRESTLRREQPVWVKI